MRSFSGISTKQWGQQKPPPGAQIDWSHPLARGLVGCWLFNDGAGLILHNSATPAVNIQLSASGFSWGTGGLISNPSTNAMVGTCAINIGTSHSVLVLYTPAEVTGWNCIFATSSAQGLYQNGNRASWDAGGGGSRNPTTTLTAGQRTHLIYTNGDSGVTWYRDGKNDGTAAAVSGSVSFATVFNDTYNEPGVGVFEQILIWNRKISAEEASLVFASPYSFLLPVTTRRYFVVGGGGAQSLSDTLSLSVSATLGDTAQAAMNSAMALAANATFADTVVAAFQAAAALSGTANFADTTTAQFASALALAGNATFAETATAAFQVALALSGSGTYANTGIGVIPAALSLAAACGLSDTGTAAFSSALDLQATANLEASGTALMAVYLVLSGSSQFEAVGKKLGTVLSSLPMFKLGLQ
jgi:hypothetical protein